ncbi:MAG: hypothetical protein J7K37_03765 [Candidatus Omnitrophica bacterium]|nr:hypothetical protein [Candidatus Omnitrophota bacterium]
MFVYFSKEKINYFKGQIAPFLIALIAIVVLLIMITVNIGKISMFKTDTSNAADAGALAGATVYGQGLMNLGFHSDMMFGFYLVAVVVLASCRWCWRAWALYATFFAVALALYLLARVMAGKIPDNVRETAYSYAFQNIGIEEVKPHIPGESYEEWLRKKSRFSQWMDDEEYKNPPHKYTWNDRYGQNYAQVVLDHVPTPTPHILWRPVVVIGLGCCGLSCGCCQCCPCLPMPFIAALSGVSHEHGPIGVTARKYRSDRDFGLWKMRYGTIESYAQAITYDGSVRPWRDHTYDSRLVSTR